MHIKSTSPLRVISFLLSVSLFSTILFAKPNDIVEERIVLITTLSPIVFPIIIPEEIPDNIAPLKPVFSITPPGETSQNSVNAEIKGEVGTRIFINGKMVGTIGSSGKIIITFDTSGAEGTKHFSIVLKDQANNISDTLITSITKISDPKFDLAYKGLTFYYQNKPSSDYRLEQLNDSDFNGLNHKEKLLIANKLLSTLFFGYPQKELEKKIDSGHFMTNIRNGLEEERTDKAWLESYILDEEKFAQYNQWNEPQAINILSRFYAMKHLDSYFFKNWIAYILTQTIMFSPAYELESTHTPNIANVYNRIVTFLNEESGMRYITYVHMMSEDNWRRFRSPEDNGREMLEIYQLDMDDRHVPIAGKALQNWKLNTDSDTLEVSLNQNTQPLNLFGTIIVNGDDFYRELVKSNLFTKGVTQRLVDFFFTETTEKKRQQLTDAITASHPETWQDILLQIIFSKEYLLYTQRTKSAEETFYSLAKKMEFKHQKRTITYFKHYLENMHQASMKYKLGKIERVPQDTLSFAYYHKYIREEVLLRRSNPDYINNYTWSRQGWSESFTYFDNFDHNSNDKISSLDAFINYIFQSMVYRNASNEELKIFRDHMLYKEDGEIYFHWSFDMFTINDDAQKQAEQREEHKGYIAFIVLDYISRLTTLYRHEKVK